MILLLVVLKPHERKILNQSPGTMVATVSNLTARKILMEKVVSCASNTQYWKYQLEKMAAIANCGTVQSAIANSSVHSRRTSR
jgi:hypothetical protein